MGKKKKCSFYVPKAEKLDMIPYGERWAIYCDCGTTIFGNSKSECEVTWHKHISGDLK